MDIISFLNFDDLIIFFLMDFYIKICSTFDYFVDFILILIVLNIFKMLVVILKVELLTYTHKFNKKNFYMFNKHNIKDINIYLLYIHMYTSRCNLLINSFYLFKNVYKL